MDETSLQDGVNESRPCKNSGAGSMVPARRGVGRQAFIAAISGPVPRICITRFML